MNYNSDTLLHSTCAHTVELNFSKTSEVHIMALVD